MRKNWGTIISKKFLHCGESSRAHRRFPNLGIWQRDWEPREFDFEGQWDLITGLPQDWRNRLWRAQTKPCAYQDRERSSYPTWDWARLACECPGVSSGGVGRQWPATGSGTLNTTVLGALACWHKSFWRKSPLSPLPLWEGTLPHPTTENWIKD